MTSKRIKRKKSCTGKIKYETKEAAEEVAGKNRLKFYPMKQHVYKCSFCRRYHIGKVGKRPGQRYKIWQEIYRI